MDVLLFVFNWCLGVELLGLTMFYLNFCFSVLFFWDMIYVTLDILELDR